MSIKVIASVMDLCLPPPSKLLLVIFAFHANDDGIAWPGVERLATKMCTTTRHVRRLLHELRKEGYLEVVGHGDGGRCMSTRYHINPDPRVRVFPSKNPDPGNRVSKKNPDLGVPKTLTPVSVNPDLGVLNPDLGVPRIVNKGLEPSLNRQGFPEKASESSQADLLGASPPPVAGTPQKQKQPSSGVNAALVKQYAEAYLAKLERGKPHIALTSDVIDRVRRAVEVFEVICPTPLWTFFVRALDHIKQKKVVLPGNDATERFLFVVEWAVKNSHKLRKPSDPAMGEPQSDPNGNGSQNMDPEVRFLADHFSERLRLGTLTFTESQILDLKNKRSLYKTKKGFVADMRDRIKDLKTLLPGMTAEQTFCYLVYLGPERK